MNLETEPFGKINEYCYKFTAPLFLVLLGRNEPSLSSKAHGRLSVGFNATSTRLIHAYLFQ